MNLIEAAPQNQGAAAGPRTSDEERRFVAVPVGDIAQIV